MCELRAREQVTMLGAIAVVLALGVNSANASPRPIHPDDRVRIERDPQATTYLSVLPWVAVLASPGLAFALLHRFRRSRTPNQPAAPANAGPIEIIEALQRVDRGFSLIVFEDFARSLFIAAHRARHDHEALASLTPYVSAHARAALERRLPAGKPVQQVTIGGLRTLGGELFERTQADPDRPDRIRLVVEFDASIKTASDTHFSVERWSFTRTASAASRPPGAINLYACPACGAGWRSRPGHEPICVACNQRIEPGARAWVLEAIEIVAIDLRPPASADMLAILRQDDAQARWLDFVHDAPEPAFALKSRAEEIFDILNRAWTCGELRPARRLLVKTLYLALEEELADYQLQSLRNDRSALRITHSDVVRVERDRYFDAVTLRPSITGHPVTRRADDTPIADDHPQDDASIKYWTMIRPTKYASEEPYVRPACSACGTPITPAATAAGVCAHCGANVAAGEREWLLAKIE